MFSRIIGGAHNGIIKYSLVILMRWKAAFQRLPNATDPSTLQQHLPQPAITSKKSKSSMTRNGKKERPKKRAPSRSSSICKFEYLP